MFKHTVTKWPKNFTKRILPDNQAQVFSELEVEPQLSNPSRTHAAIYPCRILYKKSFAGIKQANFTVNRYEFLQVQM